MKNFLLSLIPLALFSIKSYSQNDLGSNSIDVSRKGYIGISFGVSAPTGKFKDQSITDNVNGYAMGGAAFDLSFAYRLGKHFGLAAMLHGQANPVDVEAIAHDFKEESPNGNWLAESDNWTSGALLFGGYVTVPLSINGKFNFDAKLMIGFGSGTAPELKITEINSGISATQKSIQGNAMALDLSLGLRYLVAPKISLLFNMDIFGTDPEFRNGELRDSNGNTYPVDDFDQPINAVNLTVGVGFMLR